MSQPPYYPAPGGPPQPPGPPGPPPGAAPTQLGFPGQVQFPQQPQYAPTPQQAASGQTVTAVGFPGYRSPPPSKKNRTSAIVGAVVVLLTAGLAVLGFWLVSGRSDPEGAVEAYVQAVRDRDAQGAHDLLCQNLASQVTPEQISEGLAAAPEGEDLITAFSITGSEDAVVDGQEGVNVAVRLTVIGVPLEDTVFVVDEGGYKVCGGDVVNF